MGKVIGKVIATEKNPSTIDDFYFWTKQNLILNPFDVVKVSHLQESVSYGIIEEISHITDTANFLADYVSNDFGDVAAEENTHRIGMNYVKAKVIGNTGNIYIPLINNSRVELANESEVAEALGLSNVKNPVTCGYLEMYTGDEDKVTLPVNMDSRFLIGPEGAHLNISGISGLAAKTSYSMFLLRAIQDKCLKSEDEEDDVAFVLFNVKGKDLLALDEPNDFESDEEKKRTFDLYEHLGITPEPFNNVQYYYPYSSNKIGNTYLHKEAFDQQKIQGKAHLYKYSYEDDKDNLDLMFASMDDPQQTMDSIINYIITNQGGFGGLDGWDDFLDEVQKHCKAGAGGDKEITVASWRKFNRIIRKSIYRNDIFGNVHDNNEEVRIGESLKSIKKNEVHVIDIAKLSKVRSAQKSLANLEEKEKEFEEKIKNAGFIDSEEKEIAKKEIEESREKIAKAKRELENRRKDATSNEVLGKVFTEIEKTYKSNNSQEAEKPKKEEKPEDTEKNNKYLTQSLSKFGKKEQKLIARIYVIIKSILPKDMAEMVVKKIQEELSK